MAYERQTRDSYFRRGREVHKPHIQAYKEIQAQEAEDNRYIKDMENANKEWQKAAKVWDDNEKAKAEEVNKFWKEVNPAVSEFFGKSLPKAMVAKKKADQTRGYNWWKFEATAEDKQAVRSTLFSNLQTLDNVNEQQLDIQAKADQAGITGFGDLFAGKSQAYKTSVLFHAASEKLDNIEAEFYNFLQDPDRTFKIPLGNGEFDEFTGAEAIETEARLQHAKDEFTKEWIPKANLGGIDQKQFLSLIGPRMDKELQKVETTINKARSRDNANANIDGLVERITLPLVSGFYDQTGDETDHLKTAESNLQVYFDKAPLLYANASGASPFGKSIQEKVRVDLRGHLENLIKNSNNPAETLEKVEHLVYNTKVCTAAGCKTMFQHWGNEFPMGHFQDIATQAQGAMSLEKEQGIERHLANQLAGFKEKWATDQVMPSEDQKKELINDLIIMGATVEQVNSVRLWAPKYKTAEETREAFEDLQLISGGTDMPLDLENEDVARFINTADPQELAQLETEFPAMFSGVRLTPIAEKARAKFAVIKNEVDKLVPGPWSPEKEAVVNDWEALTMSEYNRILKEKEAANEPISEGEVWRLATESADAKMNENFHENSGTKYAIINGEFQSNKLLRNWFLGTTAKGERAIEESQARLAANLALKNENPGVDVSSKHKILSKSSLMKYNTLDDLTTSRLLGPSKLPEYRLDQAVYRAAAAAGENPWVFFNNQRVLHGLEPIELPPELIRVSEAIPASTISTIIKNYSRTGKRLSPGLARPGYISRVVDLSAKNLTGIAADRHFLSAFGVGSESKGDYSAVTTGRDGTKRYGKYNLSQEVIDQVLKANPQFGSYKNINSIPGSLQEKIAKAHLSSLLEKAKAEVNKIYEGKGPLIDRDQDARGYSPKGENWYLLGREAEILRRVSAAWYTGDMNNWTDTAKIDGQQSVFSHGTNSLHKYVQSQNGRGG